MSEITLNIVVSDQGTTTVLGKISGKLEDVEKSTQKASASAKGFSKVLDGMAVGVGIKAFDMLTAGVKGLTAAIPELVSRGSQVSNIANSFQALARANEQSGDQILAKTKEMTQGLVSDFGIMSAANKGMMLGLPITADAMGVLGETAIALGQAMNVGPEQAMDDLIRGLGRGSAAILDNLGIMVNAEEAQQKYADSHHKTVEMLTASEQKLAVYEAALLAASTAVDRIGGIQLTTQQRIQQGVVVWENMRDTIASTIAATPALNQLFVELVSVLKDMSSWVSVNKETIQDWVTTGVLFAIEVFQSLLTVIGYARDIFDGLRIGISFVKIGVLEMAKAFVVANLTLAEMAAKVPGNEMLGKIFGVDVQHEITASTAALKTINGQLGETEQSIDDTKESNLAFRNSLAGVQAAVDEAKNRIVSATPAVKKLGQGGKDTTGDVMSMAKAMDEASKWALGFQLEIASLNDELKGTSLTGIDKTLAGIGNKTAEMLRKLKAEADLDKTGAKQAQVKALEEAIKAYGIAASDAAIKANAIAMEKEGVGMLNDAYLDYLDTVNEINPSLDTTLEKLRFQNKLGDEHIDTLVKEKKITPEVAEQLKGMADEQLRLNEEQAKMAAVDEMFNDITGALQATLDAMTMLGISTDSAFGKMVSGTMQAIEGAGKLKDALADIKTNGLSVENAGQAVEGGVQAYKGWDKATDHRSGGKRALGGAMAGAGTGAQVGSLFGPWGTVIGAVAGGIIGGIGGVLKGKPGWAKAADEAGKTFGYKVSDQLGRAIEATSKEFDLSFGDAALLNLTAAMKESGLEAREFGDDVMNLMGKIADGTIPAEQGLAQVSESFAMIADEAHKAGRVGDAAMVGIIKQARKLGQMTPEMQAVVDAGIDMAIEGVAKFAKILDSELVKDIDSSGVYAAGMFVATFNAAVKEKGLVGAAEAMKDTFAKIEESMAGWNQVGLDVLAPIRGIFDALDDENLRPLIEGVDGLRMVMTGLADAGYLDVAAFEMMQEASGFLFDELVKGGMSTADAIRVMAPEIQAAISAAEQFGIPLTDDMQRLKELAEQNGITFKTDPMDRMVEVLEAIAKVLGADIPDAAKKAGEALNGIPPPPEGYGYGGGGGGGGYNNGYGYAGYGPPPGYGQPPPGPPPPGPPPPGAAMGAIVSPKPGGKVYNVGEGGSTEVIAPVAAMLKNIGAGVAMQMQKQGGGGAAAGGFAGGGAEVVVPPIIVNVDGQALVRIMERRMRAGAMRVPKNSVSDAGS